MEKKKKKKTRKIVRLKDDAIPPKKVCVIDLQDSPEYQHLLGRKPKTYGMHSGKVYLKPGQECGQHSTEANEEMLVFLSGRGKVIETRISLSGKYKSIIKSKDIALNAGQGGICYIPPHTLHNIRNTGIKPLVYIYCVAPIGNAIKFKS